MPRVRINEARERDGKRAIVFSTLVNPTIAAELRSAADAFVIEMFGTFVEPLERELGMKSTHTIGRSHNIAVNSEDYKNRIEAINFALAHDDGQSAKGLEKSDVILVGVSRSGKTPTSLYLAMQYGVKAANYPLIPEDFERNQLPSALPSYKGKLFGLSIAPERLSEVRNERRPEQPLRLARQLPLRGRCRGADDAARRHPLAVVDDEVDRRDRRRPSCRKCGSTGVRTDDAAGGSIIGIRRARRSALTSAPSLLEQADCGRGRDVERLDVRVDRNSQPALCQTCRCLGQSRAFRAEEPHGRAHSPVRRIQRLRRMRHPPRGVQRRRRPPADPPARLRIATVQSARPSRHAAPWATTGTSSRVEAATCRMPAAAAVRSKAPALPGSCTPSR